MSELEKNSKEYEMSYFLVADISEDEVNDVIRDLNLLIMESGGNNVVLEIPKRRWLAYPIRKQNEAYFNIAYFNIDADGLDKIKKSLALNRKILRYMILNKPLKPKLATIPVKSKNESIPASSTPAPTQSFDQKLENILNS